MLRRRRTRRAGAALACAAALASATAAEAAGPDAEVVLPPGEGNTITLSAFARNQATGDCGDLGPNACDQADAYKNWRFRRAPLSSDPSQVPDAASRETPEAGVTIVRDKAGVPHVFADGPDEQTIEER